uniref:RING-type domain-containing protein n=2 Tax=Denticeps clupeoides TaxID=299321 RepID=A0AAY4DR21_9TELE
MAQSFQSVTLSLTLPISCQICLGKVRQPVICCNNHVFCAACIEVWLKKAGQCPTCRVPITPENPCREIIGATHESESADSHSVKKRLRKTRGELLLREYEDEIETLLKENEYLRNKNLALETELKTVLDPSTVSVSRSEDRSVDLVELEEAANKLRVANDLYKEVKEDLEKLREANKMLRAQNMDLVQENMRLKAEVESRSPQKFGRYTVAALEAKIHQHERHMAHLKRALERSDKYIEELEAQIPEGKRGQRDQKDDRRPEDAQSATSISGENETNCPGHERITTMRRSLSEMEEASVHTNFNTMSCGFLGNQGLLLTTSERLQTSNSEFGEAASPQKVAGEQKRSAQVPFSPTTPSTALKNLRLKSPKACSEKKVGFRPLSYLRRLSFDDCQTSADQIPSTSGSKAAALQDSKRTISKEPRDFVFRSSLFGHLNGNSEEHKWSVGASGSAVTFDPKGDIMDTFQASSEACMDAAFQDKISELDSMISEVEGATGSALPHISDLAPPSLEDPGSLLPDSGAQGECSVTRDLQPVAGAQGSGPTTASAAFVGEGSLSPAGHAERVETQCFKRKNSTSVAIASPSKLSKLK